MGNEATAREGRARETRYSGERGTTEAGPAGSNSVTIQDSIKYPFILLNLF